MKFLDPPRGLAFWPSAGCAVRSIVYIALLPYGSKDPNSRVPLQGDIGGYIGGYLGTM